MQTEVLKGWRKEWTCGGGVHRAIELYEVQGGYVIRFFKLGVETRLGLSTEAMAALAQLVVGSVDGEPNHEWVYDLEGA